jgi:hypothetical protein
VTRPSIAREIHAKRPCIRAKRPSIEHEADMLALHRGRQLHHEGGRVERLSEEGSCRAVVSPTTQTRNTEQ